MSSTLSAEAAEWEKVYTDDDLNIYQRNVDGHRYKETYGVQHIETSLGALVALIDDVSSYTEWMYKCIDASTIDRKDQFQRTDYMVIKSPLFMKDRDVYIDSNAVYDRNNSRMTITIKSNDSRLKKTGSVRVVRLDGRWVFDQISSDKVEVSYRIISDPDIYFARAANKNMVISVRSTLQAMRSMLSRTRYRESEIMGTYDSM